MKNKIIALCCAALLFSFSFVPLRAEASDNILRIVQGYTQSSIMYAYESLTESQKEICDYLIGCYNLTYLGARGFKFNAGEITDFNSFQVTVKLLGQRIMNETGLNNWGSRMSDVFCQYVSSCIQYAQAQSSNFSTWYTNLPADFSIPYGKENYDAWNNFYNDISNDGIASFQLTESEWVSGILYDFDLSGYRWDSSTKTAYDNFILQHNPVAYTPRYTTATGNPVQFVFAPTVNGHLVDSMYILRSSSNSYTSCYFGYEFTKVSGVVPSYSYSYRSDYWAIMSTYNTCYWQSPFNTAGMTLYEFIDYVFQQTPMYWDAIATHNRPTFFYPFIKHIYLVDNANLDNPEEVHNFTGADIESDDTLATIPKEDMLFYIKQLETDLPFPYPASDPVPIKNIVINNTYNYYGDQADPATDFETAVVDRSAQSFSEPYSVDEGMFTQASEYIMYLWNNTKPLVLYTKDLLECLTITPIENDDEEQEGSTGLALAIYGSLAVGVAGGLISKLLL